MDKKYFFQNEKKAYWFEMTRVWVNDFRVNYPFKASSTHHLQIGLLSFYNIKINMQNYHSPTVMFLNTLKARLSGLPAIVDWSTDHKTVFNSTGTFGNSKTPIGTPDPVIRCEIMS